MKPFEYHEPKTLEEAIILLTKFGKLSAILAGGTDLIIKLKKFELSPTHLINIKKIKGLNSIDKHETGYHIGTLALLSDLEHHPGLRKRLPIISSSARRIGSIQVRNVATIGGNICNGAPSADMAPGLLVLDAEVNLQGPEGKRTVPIEAFFKGPGDVDLRQCEILKDIFVPFPQKGTKQIYIKHGPRRAMDCAVVGVAVALSIEEGSRRCQKARIALGAVAPTPIRAKKAEKFIEGKKIDDISFEQIAKAVEKEASPISDLRASKSYRDTMIATLFVRAIKELVGQTLGLNNG